MFLNLFSLLAIIVLLITPKYSKITYYYDLLNTNSNIIKNINCKCISCINLSKLINENASCCESCKCSLKKSLKHYLYYTNQNQIKEKLIYPIIKILYSLFYYIINFYFFKFFLELFIIFLYDTFILILNKYSLFLFSIKLVC